MRDSSSRGTRGGESAKGTFGHERTVLSTYVSIDLVQRTVANHVLYHTRESTHARKFNAGEASQRDLLKFQDDSWTVLDLRLKTRGFSDHTRWETRASTLFSRADNVRAH